MLNRCRLLGNGAEKVLVMHDFFASTESYKSLENYLDQETFTYAFFDLRGYGQSQNVEGEYTLKEVTCDCLDLAEQLGWAEFHVVGHSMTGLTIQHLNATAFDKILTATAITPVPATGSPIPEDFLEVTRAGVRGDDAIIQNIVDMASGNRYNEAFLRYKVQQFRKTATIDARLGYLDMFTQNDISSMVTGLETPYHVIVGGSDSDWHNREAMENSFKVYFPNCTITEIVDSGHYPMQETPPLLAAHLEQFLKAHQKQASSIA